MENQIYKVVGKKQEGSIDVLALVGDDHKIITVEYNPVFELLYKPDSAFPVKVIVHSGVTKYLTDWKEVYSQIYEEGIEYNFKAIDIQEDEKTFMRSLKVKDDYGLEFILRHPSSHDIASVGSTIKCMVEDITSEGLVLSSTTGTNLENQEHLKEQIKFFEQLHEKRLRFYEYSSDEDYQGLWDSIINKYPDTAHFIYELLQNADDAIATEVSFILSYDSLVFKHNGSTHFTVTDPYDKNKRKGHINAITGIGPKASSKELSANKIGKFGVGFKSVFQYADSPEIYDDLFKFRITNYIIPELIDKDSEYRNEGETLFYIKFKNPSVAYKDIHHKLVSLANGTLFLNNLKTIRWKDVVTGESRKYSKHIIDSFSTNNNIWAERLELDDYDKKTKILMFSREIDLGSNGKHKIYTGYYLNDEGTVNTKVRPEVYCFFPTSESFDSCMITHAPFLLVDSRQQVKPGEEVNKVLVQQLCKLIADSLCALRDIGIQQGQRLIDENIEQIIDWQNYNKWYGQYISSSAKLICKFVVQESCIKQLSKEALLLSSDGEYLKSNQLYKISPKSLAALLSSTQLKELRREEGEIGILDEKLNAIDYSNIQEEIGLKSYTTKIFASDITEAYMKGQPLSWINSLFVFLNNEVTSSWNPEEKDPFFLNAPIIETSKGGWVSPFCEGVINVYSDGNENEYNVISERMVTSKQIMKFLKGIGCKEPDVIDHIIKHVFADYQGENVELDSNKILSDFIQILQVFKTASLENREILVEKAKEKLLIAAINAEEDAPILHPNEVYLDSDDLKQFFKGNADVYLFDRLFYEKTITDFGQEIVDEFIKAIGVKSLPEVNHVDTRWDQLSQLQQSQLSNIKVSYTIARKDVLIYGLRQKLTTILNKQDSIAIWNVVSQIPLSEYRYGVFHYFHYTEKKIRFDSSAVEDLRNNKWIFIKGERFKPSEVCLEDFLYAGYSNYPELCGILGITKRSIDLEKAGASKEQIENERLGSIAAQLGITEADLKQLAADKNKQARIKKEAEKKEAKKSFLDQESRKELNNHGDNSFVNAITISKQRIPDEQKAVERKERLQQQKDKALDDIEKNEEYESLRETVKDLPKYSKEWFEALLQLEYKNETPKDYAGNSKVISISFGKVMPDRVSDRVFILKNPSRPIPIELETIERLEVRFEFMDSDDKAITFEVASVRDFTLRLKAKASDAKALNKLNWDKCTRATVNANNPTELMGKLITAFKDLNVEDGFNFKENLGDNVSFVFGPPGTGKTTYIAKKICGMIEQEDYCKILVLTPTNKACDVITERIAAMAETPKWLGRFVATGSEQIENSAILRNRESDIDEQDKCCLVSTIARLPYDGFQRMDCSPRLRDIDWNYIFIDEASMIPLAQIVYAIYNFSPYAKIIIAGDPLQIPPIANEEAWKEENIYSMIHLDRFDNPKTEPIQFEITNLSTQYRSIPVIGELFSQYSYSGMLSHYRSMDDQKQYDIEGLSLKPINLIQFRVERFDNIYGSKKLASSNVQIYSVLLVTELCKYISTHFYDEKELNVGIICPYVAESQMIERLVEQLETIPENIHFTVGTIHGFQGDECDMVFVVFNPPKGMKYQPDKIMLNKKHIINVAISRAKDYLFILMPHKDTDGYENLVELNRLGKIMINHCQGHYQYFTSDAIEKLLFGKAGYLEENTFVTSHQMANVYSEAGFKYEVRIDESSVDVQISDE